MSNTVIAQHSRRLAPLAVCCFVFENAYMFVFFFLYSWYIVCFCFFFIDFIAFFVPQLTVSHPLFRGLSAQLMKEGLFQRSFSSFVVWACFLGLCLNPFFLFKVIAVSGVFQNCTALVDTWSRIDAIYFPADQKALSSCCSFTPLTILRFFPWLNAMFEAVAAFTLSLLWRKEKEAEWEERE